MGEVVDAAFVQAPEHRPKPSAIQADGIPQIDFSRINYNDPPIDPIAMKDLVERVGRACRDWGFFQVVNHGVPLETRKRIEEAARKFFALSREEKMKIRRDEGKSMGYFEAEHTKNVRDWKELFDFSLEEPPFIPPSYQPTLPIHWDNQWPENPPGFKEACMDYGKEVEKLGHKIMELIAASLGLRSNRFREFFEHNTNNLRLNHYPVCPSPDMALGVGRHKDAGVLAVLATDDVPGLQVRRKTDGEWINVQPNPDSYIVNIGDMFQVWANDEYQSVEHRAMVNSERERNSYAFFMKPPLHCDVQPLEELTSETKPAKYKPINWGTFQGTRMFSNYFKSNNANIQITDFKISQ